MNNLDDLLSKMTEFLRSEAKTETIIGQPFVLGEFTCVPVMSIGLGFGAGGGEGKGGNKTSGEGEGEGAGGGAGLGMGPVGFLITKGEMIQFIPARNPSGLAAAMEKLPDLIEKFAPRKESVPA